MPSLNTFLERGGMLWSASTLTVGAGQGTWAFLGGDQFTARFKFFLFDLATGRRAASEVLTKEIRLTDPDTFEGTPTYDLFDLAGNRTATGCISNETVTRFE